LVGSLISAVSSTAEKHAYPETPQEQNLKKWVGDPVAATPEEQWAACEASGGAATQSGDTVTCWEQQDPGAFRPYKTGDEYASKTTAGGGTTSAPSGGTLASVGGWWGKQPLWLKIGLVAGAGAAVYYAVK